ncbi:MAG: DNA sulfur modification protein DndB [Gammaproteobacteria bacterium]|nr:DNA sulfur modification protein DndB [Gammaproteobacteria bacterium]MCY4304748.1 DNA sulfur modification protein DndB [Aestuariivita sp.]
MSVHFGYSFPSIRGVQANREYFISMCPMRLLPKIFLFNEEELAPELRAQRRINRSRVPEIANYIMRNRESYAFSAITASLDKEVHFSPISEDDDSRNIGILHIPMDARFIINDGQHRRAAIERAMQDMPEIGDENIAIVFFQDPGLKRCQQLFADLNRYAIRPSTSLNILYDHRDAKALLAKTLVGESGVFQGLVELEKSTLSARSQRLFTLSAIYHATNELLQNISDTDPLELTKLAARFWSFVAEQIEEWKLVRDGKITAGEVRQDFIHSHAIGLQAIARTGNALILEYPGDWEKRLKQLSQINWRRSNKSRWEGRALLAGRISKGQQNVVLTTISIKQTFGLPLSPEEQRVENAFEEEV